jgi:UTP:GlnB (protein PII) uridylyltransferase
LIDSTYAQAKDMLVKREKSPQVLSGSTALEAATRSSNSAVDTTDLRNQFARRDESVLSLRSACEQLVKEQPQHRELLVDSGTLLAEAKHQAKQGQYPTAIATLDRTYLLLKIGISAIRGGQQVTAAKNFSAPVDEYRYEQRRNDDYGQPIGGLIERTPCADWTAIAEVTKAKRSSANVSAKTGNWPAALQEIDESTIEHKKYCAARVIRSCSRRSARDRL